MQSWFVGAFVLLAVAATAEVVEDAQPAGQRSPAPPADAVIAALPFEDSDEPNRIFVDLAPEGNRPLKVLLDTGATFTTFTPRFARSLGVSVRRTKSTPYRRATRLGRDLQFYIDTSSSDTGSRTGWEYGLLGGNFLREYVVEFNFAARQVTFLNPKKFRVPEQVDAPNEAVVPIRVVSGRPIVKIGMNGKTITVLLDTGAHDPMITSGAAAKKLGVDVESLPPFGVFGTVMGPMPVSLHETESFTLGKFEFDLMPVMVAPKGWYNQGSSSDSVIGYDTLRHFTIRIDYPRERMWLRRESTMVTYQGIDYALIRKVGLFLYAQSTAYIVTGVLADTPASRLGLQAGDALTQPGGQELPDLDELIEKVVAGGPIRVMRQTKDDQWMETTLPE
jgi:predicted aspartyl protease